MARSARAQEGAGELMPLEPPAAYVAQCESMAELIGGWLEVKTAEPPRLQLPPREILVAAGLDQLPKIALNESGRRLLSALIDQGVKTFGEAPTVLQLRVVCDMVGLRVETCRLENLGIAF